MENECVSFTYKICCIHPSIFLFVNFLTFGGIYFHKQFCSSSECVVVHISFSCMFSCTTVHSKSICLLFGRDRKRMNMHKMKHREFKEKEKEKYSHRCMKVVNWLIYSFIRVLNALYYKKYYMYV